jgi:N-acetylmuramoyl-L-alanine amidase
MDRLFKSAIVALVAVAWLIFTSALSLAPAEDAAPTDAEPALPTVEAARLSMAPGRARLILDLTGPTAFAIVSLGGPDRIAIDVKAAAVGFGTPTPPSGNGLVEKYDITMMEPGRARATLTLVEPAQVQQAYVLPAFDDQPARLVVDLIPTSPRDFAIKVAADLAAARASAGTSGPAPAAGAGPPEAQAAEAPGDSPDASPRAAPATRSAGSKPLIVIDPGHGGIDSGARAAKGTMEKNVVLQFSLKLEQLLADSGRFDVALTRTDDSYLTLEQRVNLARQNRADLFVSIHADTFQQADIHGFSIYTRDENATDVLDKVLADNENRADIVSGFTSSDTPPQVVDLLLDLMRRQTRRQSYLAAEDIVNAVEPSIDLRKFPVRRANFFVLQAPDVPSILIELGFLSNATDIADLKQTDWQERAAQAMARGIANYFDDVGPVQHTASK